MALPGNCAEEEHQIRRECLPPPTNRCRSTEQQAVFILEQDHSPELLGGRFPESVNDAGVTAPEVHHCGERGQTDGCHCYQADQAHGRRVDVQVARVRHQVSEARRAVCCGSVFSATIKRVRRTTSRNESGMQGDVEENTHVHRVYRGSY